MSRQNRPPTTFESDSEEGPPGYNQGAVYNPPAKQGKGAGPPGKGAGQATAQPVENGVGERAPPPPPGTWNDIFFIAFFFVALLGFFIALGVNSGNFSKLEEATDNTTAAADDEATNESYNMSVAHLFVIIGACFAAASMFSLFWLMLIRAMPAQVVLFSMILFVSMMFFLALFCFFYVDMFIGIIFLLFACILAFFFYRWRVFIPFTAAILHATTHIILHEHPATVYTAVGGLFAMVVWFILWSVNVSLALAGQEYEKMKPGQGALLLFLLLMLYWVAQVIQTVVHCTSAGTAASWYFLAGTPGEERNATAKALKRSLTTSFGSVCFGSLIVAILRTLRQIARIVLANSDNGLVRCCVDCILGCIESLMEYFNHYAYVLVAMYGYPFIPAAKEVFRLIKSGYLGGAIVNDNLSGVVTFAGSIGTACLTAAIGAALSFAISTQRGLWVIGFIIGLILGFVLCSVVMSTVESSVSAIYVGFAEDSGALVRNNEDPEKIALHTVLSAYQMHGVINDMP